MSLECVLQAEKMLPFPDASDGNFSMLFFPAVGRAKNGAKNGKQNVQKTKINPSWQSSPSLSLSYNDSAMNLMTAMESCRLWPIKLDQTAALCGKREWKCKKAQNSNESVMNRARQWERRSGRRVGPNQWRKNKCKTELTESQKQLICPSDCNFPLSAGQFIEIYLYQMTFMFHPIHFLLSNMSRCSIISSNPLDCASMRRLGTAKPFRLSKTLIRSTQSETIEKLSQPASGWHRRKKNASWLSGFGCAHGGDEDAIVDADDVVSVLSRLRMMH